MEEKILETDKHSINDVYDIVLKIKKDTIKKNNF